MLDRPRRRKFLLSHASLLVGRVPAVLLGEPAGDVPEGDELARDARLSTGSAHLEGAAQPDPEVLLRPGAPHRRAGHPGSEGPLLLQGRRLGAHQVRVRVCVGVCVRGSVVKCKARRRGVSVNFVTHLFSDKGFASNASRWIRKFCLPVCTRIRKL